MRILNAILILLALVIGFLAGCTTTAVVVLRHPMTGKTASRGPYDARPLSLMGSALRETQCIQDFQRQGYERMP